MSLFVVDVESDGPAPGLYSMVSFGAVKVDDALTTTFYGRVGPIADAWIPEALAISGISREEHLLYPGPEETMKAFAAWVTKNSKGRPVFISDNLAFDWQFINYYLHKFAQANPFGFSGRRIGDLYCGLVRDMRAGSAWKRLRQTRHTHHPVDDAKGNAEALLAFARQHGMRLPE
jgi:hypothetical protein